MPGAETFRASADAYDRLVGRYSPQLASALSDFAAVEPGMRALDVGCGPGALAAELVQRLGTPMVRAADPSQPFVKSCRARLPGVEVVRAPAEALPFGDGTFDAALSQLVVNFMRDAEAGVREMARVARPGAIVAGLRDVRFDAITVSSAYRGFEDLWSPFLAGVAPSGAFCASLDGRASPRCGRLCGAASGWATRSS